MEFNALNSSHDGCEIQHDQMVGMTKESVGDILRNMLQQREGLLSFCESEYENLWAEAERLLKENSILKEQLSQKSCNNSQESFEKVFTNSTNNNPNQEIEPKEAGINDMSQEQETNQEWQRSSLRNMREEELLWQVRQLKTESRRQRFEWQLERDRLLSRIKILEDLQLMDSDSLSEQVDQDKSRIWASNADQNESTHENELAQDNRLLNENETCFVSEQVRSNICREETK